MTPDDALKVAISLVPGKIKSFKTILEIRESVAKAIESASLAGAEDMQRRCEQAALDATEHLSIRRPTELIVKAIRALTPTTNVLAVAEARGRLAEHAEHCNTFTGEHGAGLQCSPDHPCPQRIALAADLKRLEGK